MPLPVKRSLFQTPQRVTKRRRTTKRTQRMKIPKFLLPETKQYIQSALTLSNASAAFSNICTDITQGNDADQFIGSKYRITRLRVNYDFSQVSLSEAVRISVLIPKNASSIPVLFSARDQWDTNLYTVLHDMILPDSPDTASGTFDVTGPINVEMDNDGTTPVRNSVYVYVYSAGNGLVLRADFSYAFWFTDA